MSGMTAAEKDEVNWKNVGPKPNNLKDIFKQEERLMQELGIIEDDSKSGQAKLKNMWNKIRTKIMVEYILLIDNIIITLWFSVMTLNAYDVESLNPVLHRVQHRLQLQVL